ncbi:unannotated protein [freshwater metagenome]|uniref:Unannotated protein n=1 Tax=freshwater metagenome TaxID=449393 RepID=A0A6J6CC27_9ZZZZ
MHFIHNHKPEIHQIQGVRIDHIAQNLSGHHHDVRSGVGVVISSQNSNSRFAVSFAEFLILLITQRLYRRGVKHLLFFGQSKVNCELTDHGLSSTGRSRNQYTVSQRQSATSFFLEFIQWEFEKFYEIFNLG